MSFDKIILDASSIINFWKYYHNYFHSFNTQIRKPNFQIIFSGLNEFLIDKINSGEIIILDKVNDELRSRDLNEFKNVIKGSIVNTLFLFDDVVDLIDKYRIVENEKFLNNDEDKINRELGLFESRYADLYLIAYVNKFKSKGEKVLLITEEHFGNDRKLIPKIPIICKKENEFIYCRNIPFALFEFYKEELKFSFDVNDSWDIINTFFIDIQIKNI